MRVLSASAWSQLSTVRIVCDDLADPRNVSACVRTAEGTYHKDLVSNIVVCVRAALE